MEDKAARGKNRIGLNAPQVETTQFPRNWDRRKVYGEIPLRGRAEPATGKGSSRLPSHRNQKVKKRMSVPND